MFQLNLHQDVASHGDSFDLAGDLKHVIIGPESILTRPEADHCDSAQAVLQTVQRPGI